VRRRLRSLGNVELRERCEAKSHIAGGQRGQVVAGVRIAAAQ
jgi:hypothetical protein